MRTSWMALGLSGWLAACAGTQPATLATPATTGSGSHGSQPTAAVDADLRSLPSPGTFGDVVRAASNLDQASATQSASGCLLGGTTQPRLSADLLLGIRPLPGTAEVLAELLATDPGTPTILTAWDRIAGDGRVVMAAFTATTPAATQGKPVALFVTRSGVYVRGRAAVLAGHAEAIPTAAAGALLAQLTAADTTSVYVSAEPAVTLTELREVLRSIPDRLEVALAVTLPKGTLLPAVPARSTDLLCPDGLPEPSASETEGELDPALLRSALAPLRDAASACATSTGGRAALGGRLVLSLRIGPEGRVAQACFSEDAVDEVTLRRCIASSAQSLTLPTPSPKGFVDVALPLNIDLSGMPRQRPLCD